MPPAPALGSAGSELRQGDSGDIVGAPRLRGGAGQVDGNAKASRDGLPGEVVINRCKFPGDDLWSRTTGLCRIRTGKIEGLRAL